MKKIFTILAVFLFSAVTFAQSSGVTLTQEQINQLAPATKAQIAAIQAEQKTDELIATGSKWVGLGREIATAINESAKGVAMTAAEFADTKLGKYTLFLIAYKVIGTDLLQLIIGVVWIILILTISLYFYRNNTERVVLMSRKWNPEGKGFEKEYKKLDGDTDYKNFAIGMLCVGMAVAMLIIFV